MGMLKDGELKPFWIKTEKNKNMEYILVNEHFIEETFKTKGNDSKINKGFVLQREVEQPEPTVNTVKNAAGEVTSWPDQKKFPHYHFRVFVLLSDPETLTF